jgi:hypothetical protein
MDLAELLRAEHPAIAAEARSRELVQRYSRVRHIGGHAHVEPNPAFLVLAPFVGRAVRAAQPNETSLSPGAVHGRP